MDYKNVDLGSMTITALQCVKRSMMHRQSHISCGLGFYPFHTYILIFMQKYIDMVMKTAVQAQVHI